MPMGEGFSLFTSISMNPSLVGKNTPPQDMLTVLPRGRNFGRRTQLQKFVRPEKLAAEFSLNMPKKGRKGAELF
jgi:hypothetical protein